MKRTLVLLLISAFALVAILPSISLGNVVSAQDSGYSIERVDHRVQVMYSGHMVVADTIHVSGQVTDDFLIGLPLKYSADVLKAFAYDDSKMYTVHLGVPLGDRGGFYAAEVDFNGDSPSVFTVAFVLSNSRIEEGGGGNFTIDYPAYPSLTQTVGICNVTVTFTSTPTSISISRDGENVNTVNYLTNNLPAYTYSVGKALVRVPVGSLQLLTVDSLERQVTIDPTGGVSATETYRLTSKSTSSLSAVVLSLPPDATNIIVKDAYGGTLQSGQSPTQATDLLLVNATLSAFVNSGQSIGLTVQYTLPKATLVSGQYDLVDFDFFANYQYVVDHATVTFNLPEGATIITPHATMLGSNSTLTRQTFQDALTVTQNSVSYADNLAPQQTSLHLSFSYNPVWVSFRPTFWAALIGVVGCIGAVAYRKIRPKEQTYRARSQQLADQPPEIAAPETVKAGQPIDLASLKAFLEAYESKRLAIAELKALDVQAQKGKIQRRQYKMQRSAVETRLAGLKITIDRWRAVFLASGSSHADMVRQLDLAEADLAEAEEGMKVFEARRHRGEISLEAYRRSVADSQKVRDKADSAISGILSRLREKIRRAT
ncbi:MAG: hypothetical protein M1540_08960 [Candidatus Bathyarchaeota archaeon]|nr:hypothetical protein [Candidatus Bathyarchaeota archaeon]